MFPTQMHPVGPVHTENVSGGRKITEMADNEHSVTPERKVKEFQVFGCEEAHQENTSTNIQPAYEENVPLAE